MSQKGKHTWDIQISYHRCPNCGFVFEDRTAYRYLFGKYIKDLKCGRCGKEYTIENKSGVTIGPFFGEPGAPVGEWSDL